VKKLVIPKRGFVPREESAVSPPAPSRFLADKTGFGMTSDAGGSDLNAHPSDPRSSWAFVSFVVHEFQDSSCQLLPFDLYAILLNGSAPVHSS
jgi:hypothetical protein